MSLNGISTNTNRPNQAFRAPNVTTPGTPNETYTPGPSTGAVRSGAATISRGHSGPGVTEIQSKLKASGRSLSVDGLYGPETERTVRQFQFDNGLTPTGRIDKLTLDALDKASGQKPSPKPTPPAPKPPAPKPNGGGGGGAGPVKPTPAPKLPDNPYLAMAQVYDTATQALESGRVKKGQNAAFDATMEKLLATDPGLVGSNDPAYNEMISARARFDHAAKKAGYK